MNGLLMVVDDDSVARQTMKDILTDEGYEVIVAEDGERAAEKLEQRRPQLLLTDLEMPRMRGEALIETVRTRYPGLPIVVLTSRLAIDAERAAARLGVRGYINKPIEIDHLLSLVEASLAAENGVARAAGSRATATTGSHTMKVVPWPGTLS
jgi:DNA-binding NtrC family response regulator